MVRYALLEEQAFACDSFVIGRALASRRGRTAQA